MPRGGSFATRLKKEPGAPLGFVDPHLDEAGGGDVAVLVAHVMRLAKARRKVPVVLAQLGEHVLRIHVFGHDHCPYAMTETFLLIIEARLAPRATILFGVYVRATLFD